MIITRLLKKRRKRDVASLGSGQREENRYGMAFQIVRSTTMGAHGTAATADGSDERALAGPWPIGRRCLDSFHDSSRRGHVAAAAD